MINEMADKLDKPIVVESTDKVDKKNIMVCLQTDQTIRLKLKGSDEVQTIGIKDLFDYIKNGPKQPEPKIQIVERIVEKEVIKEVEKKPTNTATGLDVKGPAKNTEPYDEHAENQPYINLHEFRSAYMVMAMPLDVKVKLESVTCGLLTKFKDSRKMKEAAAEEAKRNANKPKKVESEETTDEVKPDKTKKTRKKKS
jgi:hypothetical protein